MRPPCVLLKTRLKTPSRTLMDHRGMVNCRLLRPAVIGLICHGGKASWEARWGEVGWVEVEGTGGQERGASLPPEMTTMMMMIVDRGCCQAESGCLAPSCSCGLLEFSPGRSLTALIALQESVIERWNPLPEPEIFPLGWPR